MIRDILLLKGLKRTVIPAISMISRKTQTSLASYRKPIQNEGPKPFSFEGVKMKKKTTLNKVSSTKKKKPVSNIQRTRFEWINRGMLGWVVMPQMYQLNHKHAGG